MKRIGTAKEAAQIDGVLIGKHVPDGWKWLGSGAYRNAYLSPTGVVYKVCRDSDSHNNDKEWRTYRKATSMKAEGFRIAACRVFASGVLAMEYVKDDGSDVDDSFEAMRKFMRKNFDYLDCSRDKRGENWHAVDGVAVITDYAYGYDES